MIKNKKTFKHLTLEDREIIYHMRFVEKASLQKISDFINKSKSTISYELSNRRKKSKYISTIAHNSYRRTLCKKDVLKIDENPRILKYIKHRLILIFFQSNNYTLIYPLPSSNRFYDILSILIP